MFDHHPIFGDGPVMNRYKKPPISQLHSPYFDTVYFLGQIPAITHRDSRPTCRICPTGIQKSAPPAMRRAMDQHPGTMVN